jgi:F-type H+-transporting ATPase subunit delta
LAVAEAEITSARELTAQERDALNKALEKMLGKQVDAKYALDAGLIAGARVRVGSTIYDGSVREQLNRLRARLVSE